MSDDWTVVANYASTTEADIYIAILRAAGIPAVLRADIGIFGPGFSGATPRGAAIAVPRSLAHEALELIGDGDVEEDEAG
ncbi:MAG: hypothetical protein ACT443_07300 [Gemmatimonadota bacterium]